MSISMRTVNKRRKSLIGQYNYSGTPMRISNYQNNLNYSLLENYIHHCNSTTILNEDNGNEVFQYFVECCKIKGINSTSYQIANYMVSDIVPKIKDHSRIQRCIQENSEILPEDMVTMFQEAFHTYQTCDRVLRNDDRLNKRFNIDKFIYNHPYMSTENMVTELCNFIDTYDIPISSKFYITLENVMYSFFKNSIPFSNEVLVEQVYDYYMTRDIYMSDHNFISLHNIIESNEFVEDEIKNSIMSVKENHIYFADKVNQIASHTSNDQLQHIIYGLKDVTTENTALNYMNQIKDLLKEESLCEEDVNLAKDSIYMIPLISTVSEEYIDSYIGESYKDHSVYHTICNIDRYCEDTNDYFSESYQERVKDFSIELLESVDLAESKDIKKILDEFKQDQNKSPERFKTMIRRIFTKSPKSIIDGLPSIMSIMKTCFILGTATIPMAGPVIACLLLIVNKLITDKISYEETDKLIKKLQSEKDAMNKKKDSLTNSDEIKKVEDYIKCIDNCIKKLKDYMRTIKDDEEEDDFDDDFDDDLDFDFDESVNMIHQLSENMIETLNYDRKKLNSSIRENLHKFTSDLSILEGFSYLVINSPNVISVEEYTKILKDERFLSRDPRCSTILSYVTENLYSYKEKKDPVTESIIESMCLKEMDQILNEGIDINNLKLGLQSFKKQIQKLDTKQKSFWQSVDVNSENLLTSLQRAMTSDRREAIIKGSMIPSMSKLCKSILTVAGTAGIGAITGQPWLPVLTAVTMFASSKYLNDRERKLIYDEIDTELTVVEKQIEMASSEGDINQYRFLLNYQKRLQREKYRIKYGRMTKGRQIPVGGKVHA